MSTHAADQQNIVVPLASPVRFWHLAIIVLCLAALLTGDGADDYKHAEHAGFLLHGGIGIGVFAVICLYLGYGLFGPQQFRLSAWFPFTKERLAQVGRVCAS